MIGACTGALAAYGRAGRAAIRVAGVAWLRPMLATLNMFMRIVDLLDAARLLLPDVDASVTDAAWKQCGGVRLPQNVALVRPCRSALLRIMRLHAGT